MWQVRKACSEAAELSPCPVCLWPVLQLGARGKTPRKKGLLLGMQANKTVRGGQRPCSATRCAVLCCVPRMCRPRLLAGWPYEPTCCMSAHAPKQISPFISFSVSLSALPWRRSVESADVIFAWR